MSIDSRNGPSNTHRNGKIKQYPMVIKITITIVYLFTNTISYPIITIVDINK